MCFQFRLDGFGSLRFDFQVSGFQGTGFNGSFSFYSGFQGLGL